MLINLAVLKQSIQLPQVVLAHQDFVVRNMDIVELVQIIAVPNVKQVLDSVVQ